MSTNQRGFLVLIGVLVFGAIFCVWLPFVFLPGNGIAVSLPVITVPGEPLTVFGLDTTNTVLGTILADVFALLIAFGAWFATRRWTRTIPGRFQSAVELLVDGWWGITRQMAGSGSKVKNLLFPLTASILLFLLAANLGKLIPGVETVGFIHCAHEGYNGLPRQEIPIQNSAGGYQLRNEQVLNVGTAVTIDAYHRCKSFTGDSHYAKYAVMGVDPFLDAGRTYVVQDGDTLERIAASLNAEVATITSQPVPEGYASWADLTFTPEMIAAANTDAGGTLAIASADGADSPATDAQEGEEAAAILGGNLAATTPLAAGQTLQIREPLVGVDATLADNQLYAVTPFFRGAATDLNVTIGLALIAFLAIQAFGISELGLNYFQKFINVHALGNLGKNPIGAIDFIAGLFEIISEFAKIISLAFRLFGAITAGAVLYAVILFLVGTVTPVIILGLEVIVGVAQAGVFAILTLIFSAQAMVSHIHDEDHGHEEAHQV